MMAHAEPLRMTTYRLHRLQLFEDGPGWAVRIYAPSGGLFRPAELTIGRPDGLEDLMGQAMTLIDETMPRRPSFTLVEQPTPRPKHSR